MLPHSVAATGRRSGFALLRIAEPEREQREQHGERNEAVAKGVDPPRGVVLPAPCEANRSP
jgi:hypothetical protein